MSDVKRPALRYYGGKWRLAPWIISHFGVHEVYVEPFGGSAAVLLRKKRSLIEVYNDLDFEVVNFFYVLREYPERLMEVVGLTPFALSEYEFSQSSCSSSVGFLADVFVPERPFEWVPCGKDIERMIEAARLFYVRSYLGITGPTSTWQSGFRRQKVFSRGRNGAKVMTPAAVSFMRTSHLRSLADRLRGVTIDNLDGLACVGRYDSEKTLFYVDPPYLHGMRKRTGGGYRHEMSDEDHESLLQALREVRGQVVISGYRNELYERMLRGWRRFDRQSRTDGSGSAVESVWLNGEVGKAECGMWNSE